MTTALYLVDSAREGLDNMALDQAMLHQTDRDGVVRIRFYRWLHPTLSLGYFQKFSEFGKFQQRSGGDSSNVSAAMPLSVVRRATGGGAIVHHFDWTYSIAIPQRLEAQKRSLGAACGLYFSIHRAVIQWLNRTFDRMSYSAELWGQTDNGEDAEVGCGNVTCGPTIADSSAFLCFQRRSPGDIVVGGNKLMGSAQRRYQSTILQHGSLLLASSPFATELIGLRDLLRKPNGESYGDIEEDPVQLEEFASTVLRILKECYQLDMIRLKAGDSLVDVDPVLRNRLESREWLARI